MNEHNKYLISSYVTCVFAQVAFAAYAIVRYTMRLMHNKKDASAEEFITARGTQNRWRIAWSFFASAVGAWVITAPASFSVYTGIVGLAMYAFASGIPVLIIALFGARIQSMHPEVCTLPDFVGKRFGPVARTLVVIISLLTMCIALLAEYTTIGLLFKYFVGSVDYPIVIVVGVLTMCYTAYGGTFISIVTDQAQGIVTALFILLLVIYVAVTFRPASLPKPLPEWLGPNKAGYSAIFSMPCSLIAATVFSEAMWQKVWASQDRAAVVFGGGVGFLLITVAVFLLGFGGWLAAWAGWVTQFTDPNLFLFQIFSSDKEAAASTGGSVQVNSWIGVIVLILACTMNESAIDSMQNGIAAVLSQHLFRRQHSIFPRLVLLVVNVPLIVISLQGYPVLSLFLITNMLTTCCFLLVALGLWAPAERYVTESGLCFGFSVAMLTVTAYGIGDNWSDADKAWSVRYGAWFTWYGNIGYDWDYFLVGSCFSLVGLLMWIAGAQLLHRVFGIRGPGISGLLRRLPGFAVITGDGFSRDLLSYRLMAPVARALRYTPHEGAFDTDSAGSSDDGSGVATAKDPAAVEAAAIALKLGQPGAQSGFGDSALTYASPASPSAAAKGAL